MKWVKAWAPAIAWMGVIFMMSAMPGDMSGAQSGRLLALVIGVIRWVFGEEAAAQIPPETLHLLIRKAAHMAEYAVLFLLDDRALRMSGVKRHGWYALMLCAAYAATDEWHQSFTADRGPSIIDVGIDTTGAALMWGVMHIKRKRR